VLGLRPAPEFEEWLLQMGIFEDQDRLKATTARHPMVAPQLAFLEPAGPVVNEF
jgi:hypothetical protein